METSKVRKFWTFNPFYPELSGMLITFILSSFYFVLGCSDLDFFPLHISSLSYFLSLLLFYPLVEIQKKKIHKANLKEKYICLLTLSAFFPLHFNIWLFLFIFWKKRFLMCCWDSFCLKQFIKSSERDGR